MNLAGRYEPRVFITESTCRAASCRWIAESGRKESLDLESMSHDLKTIVRDGSKAKFSHYRDGNFFYMRKVHDQAYSFPIPIEDTQGTTMFAEFKAITLMCWIRKAIEDKTFQPVES